MCGIFGYFNRQLPDVDEALFDRMGRSLSHRGPNGRGKTSAQGVGIGNERLSIIDPEGGGQPFLSDDDGIALVQNGEIYNYVELAQELKHAGVACRTHSDTEVLLRLYEREGIRFVNRLNGMFAIAIHDRREGALYLIRDRMGVKPLYIHDDSRRLLFGSEIKALLAAGVRAELNPEAIHHYLTFNYVPAPMTAFKGIRHLEPGHWMRVTTAGTEVRRWWDLAAVHEADWDERAARECFLELLDDAVRLRMRSDVPFGAFLSGGLDSSSVVSRMVRHQPTPVQTFTIGFEEPRFDESPFAREAADRFATHHHMERVSMDMTDLWPLTLYHCDQPHGDASFMPYLQVSRAAARNVTMVLTGDGGDELFGGYQKYAAFFAQSPAHIPGAAFGRAYHDFQSLFTEAAKLDLYAPAFRGATEGMDSFDLTRKLLAEVQHLDTLNQALYLDCMQLLPGNNLVKPDRMPMAASLEARSPFMDVRMVEFAFSLPGHFKVRQGETRYLYKRAVEPLLGPGLTHRTKQMFTVPIGEWFRTKLRPLVRGVLLSSRAADRGLFDPAQVLRILDAHQDGSRNFTREIRALVALELWFRIFLDSPGVGPAPTFETLALGGLLETDHGA